MTAVLFWMARCDAFQRHAPGAAQTARLTAGGTASGGFRAKPELIQVAEFTDDQGQGSRIGLSAHLRHLSLAGEACALERGALC